jgi:hypothetical protein
LRTSQVLYEVDGGCLPGTTCREVASTVKKVGGIADKLCTGHSTHLYQAQYNTIVKAEKYVDVTSLDTPDMMVSGHWFFLAESVPYMAGSCLEKMAFPDQRHRYSVMPPLNPLAAI